MIHSTGTPSGRIASRGWWLLLAAFAITLVVYWPGLSGGYLFDDYPNIVDNRGVQPTDASLPSLVRAALSSPSSEFKRPLASLSFAANFLAAGLDPYWMKLTNLLIHLLNGWLAFLLARSLLDVAAPALRADAGVVRERHGRVAAFTAAAWLLLPINLTGVLYVVQRMESMANVFVLLGLIGYVAGRRRMLAGNHPDPTSVASDRKPGRKAFGGFAICVLSLTIPTAMGLLAKETAVMLPLYAGLVELCVFRFRKSKAPADDVAIPTVRTGRDLWVLGLFVVLLALPMVIGLAWLLPHVLSAGYWSTRDFTLGTRLLSEARIVADYVAWTLLPTPGALSFYHDDFRISTGLFAPWTTFASMLFLLALLVIAWLLRTRRPLVTLGIALYLGCHLLTGTILPLELVYEHRNYFASFGLLLAIVPLLAVPRMQPFALPRHVLLAGLLLLWGSLTALTAYAWGDPLRLASDLATRAPASPRAQYELGRTYVIYSHYDPSSPFTKLAYGPLEKAAAIPGSSILPEQALIFMNARMHLPLKDVWWYSLVGKLKARRPGVQDESSLAALTQCAHEHECDLPKQRMIDAYMAALSHPDPSARLCATYGDYAWNVLGDHELGLRMTEEAMHASPAEPAYRITLVRMLAALGRTNQAHVELQGLQTLDVGGSLDSTLQQLRALPGLP